jgi:hypothetical protein
MHEQSFRSLPPSNAALERDVAQARVAAENYARAIDGLVEDGPDKTYLMRKFREVAMWVNTAIIRNSDGSPRT